MFELPGYETLGKIGEGGMATVWQARHLTLDRLVAIKVLTANFSEDIEFLERFRTEAQAAARINHPNIVAVFDAGEANGLPFYVMEYAPGETVSALIHEHTRVPEEIALRILLDIAKAMRDVWDQHKIIHCDIKPENIILDADHKVKVLDLGLARILDAAKEIETQESDETVGTPNFMAPEQAMGRDDLDPRADIYSAGAMLYQMVTGKLPFDLLDPNAVLDGQVNGFIEDPAAHVDGLKAGSAWLIEKMMVKKRDKRHETWDQVISDIKCAMGGFMIESSPPREGESTVLRSPERRIPKKKRVVVSKQSLRSATGDEDAIIYNTPNNESRSLYTLLGLLGLVLVLYFFTFVVTGGPA